MKVLSIGQLPTEIGGNYSTGMGKVVYELSRCNYGTITYETIALNASDSNIRKDLIPNLLSGYKIKYLSILKECLSHPIKLVREYLYYKRFCPYNPFRGIFYRLNIESKIKSIHPDIIHMHSIDYALPIKHIASKDSAKTVLTCHGIFNLHKASQKKYYEDVFSQVDYVTGLTDEIHTIFRNFKIDETRISIIPNGVDITKFHYSSQERDRLRKGFNIPKETTVFLTVASIQQRKGQLAFLNDLKDSGLDYIYWIIGKGPDQEIIQKYAQENGISDRVKVFGYIEAQNLYSYYSAADVYAHVSLEEGQALSEIEAYTCGMKILVNEKIKNTVVSPIMNKDIYMIQEIGSINWHDLNDWILEIPKKRDTRPNYQWQNIADKYIHLYTKVND